MKKFRFYAMLSCIVFLGLLKSGCIDGAITLPTITTMADYDIGLSFVGESDFCFNTPPDERNFTVTIELSDGSGAVIPTITRTINNSNPYVEIQDISLPNTGIFELTITATGSGCFSCCAPFECIPGENQPVITNQMVVDLSTFGSIINITMDNLACNCCP